MTQQARNDLNTQTATLIPDNTTGLVSPADVRVPIIDVADSAFNLTDDNATDIALSGSYVGTTAGAVAAADAVETAISKLDKQVGDLAAGSGIPASTADAKGDLIVATANDAVTRLAIGANGTVPLAASGQATGIIWSALTTAEVAASTNKNYVTDAEAVVIGNTSGTNTGDQDATAVDLSGAYVGTTAGAVAAADAVETAISKLDKQVGDLAASSGIPASTVDAKGDVLVATADDSVTRLAVGADGEVLTADSAEATGVKWVAGGLASALNSAQIFVGNGSNVATGVAVSGEASIDNAGAVTLDNDSVIGKALTGFVLTDATDVVAADTIVVAAGKLQRQVDDLAAGSGIPASTADAKGDLLAADANDSVIRLAVGADGEVLTADSAEATGVKWAAAAGGGLATTVSGGATIVHDGAATPTFSDNGAGTGTLTTNGANVISLTFTANSSGGGAYILNHNHRNPDVRAWTASTGVSPYFNTNIVNGVSMDVTGINVSVPCHFNFQF